MNKVSDITVQKLKFIRNNQNSSVKIDMPDNNLYLKDLKYLNPANGFVKAGASRKTGLRGRGFGCRELVRIWLREIVCGVKQLFYGGSLHGVKYIFEPTFGRNEKVVWIIIMIVSIAICIINITNLLDKWTSTPFVNVIDSLPTPIWAVPFPTVVLCPQLHLKLSFANVSELKGYFASLLCPRIRIEEYPLSLTETKMLRDFIVKGSLKCTDVIKQCYWRTGPHIDTTSWTSEFCCDELFRPTFTSYGLCFAFNSLPLNGMTKETLPWQKNMDPYVVTSPLEWDLDKGYPKVFPPNLTMLPRRVMSAGDTNSLGVELYLNISEHQIDCDPASLGFHLLIKSPPDHVYTSTGLRLPMDRKTSVEISPITYKTDASLRYLTPEKRQCLFQNERKLDYYAFYTESNCKQELLFHETRRLCRCVQYNWPRLYVWETICSTTSDYSCMIKVQEKVEEELVYAYYAESEEQSMSAAVVGASCHPSCNDILYSSQVFYSDLTKGLRFNDTKPEECARIDVYFYDDMFLGQHRHAQYDDYYFIGAVGGVLSLFLGFSIISVAEIIFFLIFRPVHVLLRKIYC